MNVTIAINNAAPYYPFLDSNKNLILTAIPLKISQINLKIVHIQEINISRLQTKLILQT